MLHLDAIIRLNMFSYSFILPEPKGLIPGQTIHLSPCRRSNLPIIRIILSLTCSSANWLRWFHGKTQACISFLQSNVSWQTHLNRVNIGPMISIHPSVKERFYQIKFELAAATAATATAAAASHASKLGGSSIRKSVFNVNMDCKG